MERQSTYPISPTATTPSNTCPNGASSMVWKAPFWSVVLPPPALMAASIARTPMTTYTTPLAAYPNRAIHSTQGLARRAASSA
jgi:hypothetical protein